MTYKALSKLSCRYWHFNSIVDCLVCGYTRVTNNAFHEWKIFRQQCPKRRWILQGLFMSFLIKHTKFNICFLYAMIFLSCQATDLSTKLGNQYCDTQCGSAEFLFSSVFCGFYIFCFLLYMMLLCVWLQKQYVKYSVLKRS